MRIIYVQYAKSFLFQNIFLDNEQMYLKRLSSLEKGKLFLLNKKDFHYKNTVHTN